MRQSVLLLVVFLMGCSTPTGAIARVNAKEEMQLIIGRIRTVAHGVESARQDLVTAARAFERSPVPAHAEARAYVEVVQEISEIVSRGRTAAETYAGELVTVRERLRQVAFASRCLFACSNHTPSHVAKNNVEMKNLERTKKCVKWRCVAAQAPTPPFVKRINAEMRMLAALARVSESSRMAAQLLTDSVARALEIAAERRVDNPNHPERPVD